MKYVHFHRTYLEAPQTTWFSHRCCRPISVKGVEKEKEQKWTGVNSPRPPTFRAYALSIDTIVHRHVLQLTMLLWWEACAWQTTYLHTLVVWCTVLVAAVLFAREAGSVDSVGLYVQPRQCCLIMETATAGMYYRASTTEHLLLQPHRLAACCTLLSCCFTKEMVDDDTNVLFKSLSVACLSFPSALHKRNVDDDFIPPPLPLPGVFG